MLHDFSYYPVVYRVEIMLGGDKAAEVRTLQPLATFAAGDLLNPRGICTSEWPALADLVGRGN